MKSVNLLRLSFCSIRITSPVAEMLLLLLFCLHSLCVPCWTAECCVFECGPMDGTAKIILNCIHWTSLRFRFFTFQFVAISMSIAISWDNHLNWNYCIFHLLQNKNCCWFFYQFIWTNYLFYDLNDVILHVLNANSANSPNNFERIPLW